MVVLLLLFLVNSRASDRRLSLSRNYEFNEKKNKPKYRLFIRDGLNVCGGKCTGIDFEHWKIWNTGKSLEMERLYDRSTVELSSRVFDRVETKFARKTIIRLKRLHGENRIRQSFFSFRTALRIEIKGRKHL